ncbi:hypothetical protein B566_EDAN010119, partial [Ephemera danica]
MAVTALIIGLHTGKVLYMGAKNKYCTKCSYRESKGLPASTSDHACSKNWDNKQSAASMESAIIAEGFTLSEDMYGIKYNRMLGDGGSSAPPVALRKIVNGKLKKFRSSVTKAMQFRREEDVPFETKIQNLRSDILNSIHHIFGDHKKCATYFCDGSKDGESNIVPDLQS